MEYATKAKLASIVTSITTEGTKRVKPVRLLHKKAHTTSNKPAKNREIQAMRGPEEPGPSSRAACSKRSATALSVNARTLAQARLHSIALDEASPASLFASSRNRA